MAASFSRFSRAGISALLLGGTLLLVYHKKVGINDPNGISVIRLLLRPDIWFLAAVLSALATMSWTSFRPRRDFPPARIVLWNGPAAAFATALIGSLVGWLRYGVAGNNFGVQSGARMILCLLLGSIIYKMAAGSSRFAHRLSKCMELAPVVNVLLSFLVILSPAAVSAIFGPAMLEEGDGMFSFGARFQGFTSNPNIVASSSAIAFALLLPRLERNLVSLNWAILPQALYVIGLIGVIIWSGVRALVLLPVFLVVVSFWLTTRLTQKGLRRLVFIGGAMGIIAAMALGVLWRSTAAAILLDRLGGENGRTLLWKFYAGKLVEHPLGLGFGFETIVGSDAIIVGQRLPPHNTFLEMGMYGGVIGLVVHVVVIGVLARQVVKARDALRWVSMPLRLQSLLLAWMTSGIALCFAGLIFIDYAYVILAALLLADLQRYRSDVLRAQEAARPPDRLNISATLT